MDGFDWDLDGQNGQNGEDGIPRARLFEVDNVNFNY